MLNFGIFSSKLFACLFVDETEIHKGGSLLRTMNIDILLMFTIPHNRLWEHGMIEFTVGLKAASWRGGYDRGEGSAPSFDLERGESFRNSLLITDCFGRRYPPRHSPSLLRPHAS